MTASRIQDIDIKATPNTDAKALKDNLVKALYRPHTIYKVVPPATADTLAPLFDPSLDRDQIALKLLAMGGPGGTGELNHYHTLTGNVVLQPNYAKLVANEIYVAVQHAKLIHTLDSKGYEVIADILRTDRVGTNLRDHWKKSPPPLIPDEAALAKLLTKLSTIHAEAKNITDQVDDALKECFGIDFTSLPILDNAQAKALVQKVSYDESLPLFKDFPVLVDFFARLPVKTELLRRWGERLPPNPQQLQAFWTELSAPPFPLDEKRVITTLSKLFNHDAKLVTVLTTALSTPPSILADLAAETAYMRFLDGIKHLGELSDLFKVPDVRVYMIAKLKDGGIKITDVNEASLDIFYASLQSGLAAAPGSLTNDHIVVPLMKLFNLQPPAPQEFRDVLARLPVAYNLATPPVSPPAPGINTPNNTLLTNVTSDLKYAQFMRDQDNQKALTDFPLLKKILENDTVKKALTHHNLAGLKLSQLISSLQTKTPLPTDIEEYKEIIKTFFGAAGTAGAGNLETALSGLPLPTLAVFQRGLALNQFMQNNEPALQKMPTLAKILQTPNVQAILAASKDMISAVFIDTLLTEMDEPDGGDLKASMIDRIITAAALADNKDNKQLKAELEKGWMIDSDEAAQQLRGELRFHQFITELNKSGNAKLIQLFDDPKIKTALLEYWKTQANWQWTQASFPQMVDNLVTAIADLLPNSNHSALAAKIATHLQNGTTVIPGFDKIIETRLTSLNGRRTPFHKHVLLEAQFKQRMAALSKTNKALADVMSGGNVRVFLENAWLQNGFPTKEAIRKLERALAAMTKPNDAIIKDLLATNLLPSPLSVQQKELFFRALKTDNLLSHAASLANLVASSKYAVFLEQLNKAPGLEAIFADPTTPIIKTLLEQYWETNPVPTHAEFQQFFVDMASVAKDDHAAAQAAIQKLIFKGATNATFTAELNKTNLIAPSTTGDKTLEPLRGEARLALFDQYANGLLATPSFNSKRAELIKLWQSPDNKFPNKDTIKGVLKGLSDQDPSEPVDGKDLANFFNKHFNFFHTDPSKKTKIPILEEKDFTDSALIIATARYDFLMLSNEDLLNSPNGEILKDILTKPDIKQALIEHWKTGSFDLAPLEELLEALKNAKTGQEIHNAFKGYFQFGTGSAITTALNQLYPNTITPLTNTVLVDKAKAELARRDILANIDQRILSEAFLATGVTLTKVAVDALNQFLRERTSPPDLKAEHIADVITAKLTNPEKAAFDAKYPAGLDLKTVQDIQRNQQRINQIYTSFVSEGQTPGTNLKNVNNASVTTAANQELRNVFLREKNWVLDAKNPDGIKKLLETNYHGLDYDTFIQDHLLPALLVNGGKPSIPNVKLMLTEKDFAVIQHAYFSSSLNAKLFEQSLFQLTLQNANAERVHKIKGLLEEATNDTALLDAPYSETLSAREKENIDKKIAKIEKLQENLEGLYKTRETIQAQLDIFKQTLLKYPKNMALDEKLGGIELSNGTLKNIFNLLVKDSDPEISDAAKNILKDINLAKHKNKNYHDYIRGAKSAHPEYRKAFAKMAGIHYAWKHKDQIEKLIDKSKNQDEMDKLVISIDEAKKIHETYKKIKDNAALLPQERLVARYYSDVSTTTFDLDEGFGSAKIASEVEKLQGKYGSSSALTTLSAGIDMSMVADRVAGGEIMRANLENKKTLMYEHTLGMIGVLAVDSKEVSIGVRLDGGGSGGLVSGQEKPHTLLLYLAKKTEHHFLPDRGPDKPDPKDPKKTIPGDIIKDSQLEKAKAFWLDFQSTRVDKLTPDNLDKEIQKYLAEKVAKAPNDAELRGVVNNISPMGNDLSSQYIAASTKRVGASGWGERGALLPNINFFRTALININTIAGTTNLAYSDQKLIRDEKSGQYIMKGRVSKGVPLKVDTRDYMLYVAIMCAARRKGYKVINLTQFPPIPERQMAIYMRALSHPGEDNEHRKLFKLTEAQLRGEQSNLSQTEVIRREAKDLDVKLIKDKTEAPKWPRPK